MEAFNSVETNYESNITKISQKNWKFKMTLFFYETSHFYVSSVEIHVSISFKHLSLIRWAIRYSLYEIRALDR